MRRALLLAALGAVLPAAARAQGALGVQGYGYPTGQLGAASAALGGSSAEIDAASPINPAALGVVGRYSVYMMYEPEFRTTTVGSRSATSTTMRFPNFLVTGGFRRLTVGVSASNFLDRTWRNVYQDSQVVGGELLPSTLTAASAGAITDARLGLAYWINDKWQVGLGLHALTGQNRLEFGRSFPDSTGVGDVTQLSTMTYSGSAVSAGVIYAPTAGFVIGASLRKGGGIEVAQSGATLATADTPDRYGLTVAYTGIPNTTLAARFEHTGWSSMDALGGPQMTTFDANDVGAGVEVVGPKLGGLPTFARLGLRSRGLPFGADGEQVKETGLGGGITIPVARGRGQIDLALQRARRRAAGADERAWLVSIGLGIKP